MTSTGRRRVYSDDQVELGATREAVDQAVGDRSQQTLGVTAHG